MLSKTKHRNDPIIERLQALARETPALKDSARIYQAILPLIRDADLAVSPVSLTLEEAREKMGKDVPLLHHLDLELDVEALRELMIELALAVESIIKQDRAKKLLSWGRVSHAPEAAAGRIRRALEEKSLDIRFLLAHIAAGQPDPVKDAANDLGLDHELLWTLAQDALKPALRTWSGQLSSLVKGIPWKKGRCFVCGAAPFFAELQDNSQVKHLRCGACGADWLFRRLQCIYCGNEDHKSQRYFYVGEDRERVRVEVCDKCHGYLKVISAFTPTSTEMLSVEDLSTLQLDYIAQEHGYTRVPLP